MYIHVHTCTYMYVLLQKCEVICYPNLLKEMFIFSRSPDNKLSLYNYQIINNLFIICSKHPEIPSKLSMI